MLVFLGQASKVKLLAALLKGRYCLLEQARPSRASYAAKRGNMDAAAKVGVDDAPFIPICLSAVQAPCDAWNTSASNLR